MLNRFARNARQRMRLDGGGYRRDHLRALAQRVEVDEGELRICRIEGPASPNARANGNGAAVPSQGLKWQGVRSTNPDPRRLALGVRRVGRRDGAPGFRVLRYAQPLDGGLGNQGRPILPSRPRFHVTRDSGDGQSSAQMSGRPRSPPAWSRP